MTPAQLERFESKYIPDPNSGCWIWIGACSTAGYAQIKLERNQYAYRASYEHYIGSIPNGLHMDHLCRVHCCVNPRHVEPVTCKENVRRGKASEATKLRALTITHCPQGHPYAGNNLYSGPKGRRGCRACRYVAGREYRTRNYVPPAPRLLRTHCVHGHLVDGDNLYVAPDGYRHCKVCRSIAGRKNRSKL